MIDIEIWAGKKRKETHGGNGGGAVEPYADEATHAERADKAGYAESAKASETAQNAERAERAKTADEAIHAKNSDEVSLESKTLARFIRKDVPGTAKEVITFLKGIIVKAVSYFEGIVNRGDISNTGDIHNTGDITNAGDITTKNLTVTDKATFFELEIQKAKAAGGIVIQSAATFKVDDYEETDDGYACYQLAEKDGKVLRQMCRKGDQMLCHGGLNMTTASPDPSKGGGTGTPTANHFYWRLVTDAPEEPVERRGKKYLMIVLSKTEFAKGSDKPQVGDELAQVGNRVDADRQCVIINSAYKSLDVGLVAPYWAKYVGVDDYKLETHRETYFARNDNQIVGNLRARSSSGELKPVPVLLGEWKSGKEYGYYDSVTHDGRQWLCIVEPGKRTTEEPGKGDAWMMLVDKGSKGDKGESSCTVNIFTDTPNGNIIRNGQGSVWLFAVVYYGTKEITETLKDWQFSWVIHSGNPEFDALWNKRHQQCGSRIELSAQEVNNIAQVECLICDNVELKN